MEINLLMKLVFSRKGFDSSSGGCPSPIFPDGRMISLPIPDKQSCIRYAEIRWNEYNMGELVSGLTEGRISPSFNAHLDPDINEDSLPRSEGWKPILGQTGCAQSHLRKNDVKDGDIFLFFGLFRHVIRNQGRLIWVKGSQPRHVLWGWMQVGEVVSVDSCDKVEYEWAKYHPHFHREADKNNTIYISRGFLKLPKVTDNRFIGAGVFPSFSEELLLTSSSARTPSLWELPSFFYPQDTRPPLTFHGDLTRWEKKAESVELRTVGRGQEFILDCEEYPEAVGWLYGLLIATGHCG